MSPNRGGAHELYTSQSLRLPWHPCVTLLPHVGCALSTLLIAQETADLYPAARSTAIVCNRNHIPAPPSIPISLNSYHSPGSPLPRLDQEAREHKPRQCLLHRGRLSRQWLGVRDSGGRLRALRRIQMRNWKESARGERKEEVAKKAG